MSEVVDTLPTPCFRRKYAWENWTDGRIHWLKRGEDFHVDPAKFVRAAYRHAERHDLILAQRSRGDDVWLVFRRYG